MNEDELAVKYPAYWKPLPKDWRAIDTYRVNVMFPIEDTSGRLIHARKKLLVCGTRTGGKSMLKDVQEAYDTLGAWLADNDTAEPAIEQETQVAAYACSACLDTKRMGNGKLGTTDCPFCKVGKLTCTDIKKLARGCTKCYGTGEVNTGIFTGKCPACKP